MKKTVFNSGSYQLLIEIKNEISLRVGAFGVIVFERGEYVYTGSAMKNLSARIARHLSNEKKLRWHIDYLLVNPAAEIAEVLRYPSTEREECLYNRAALDAGGTVPTPRFGSTDCPECPSHLVKIDHKTLKSWLRIHEEYAI